MDEIIKSYDEEDYDVVKEMIPCFFNEAWTEYNSTFNLPYSSRKDPTFAFLVAERIYIYLLDSKFWNNVDLDIIMEITEKHFDCENY